MMTRWRERLILPIPNSRTSTPITANSIAHGSCRSYITPTDRPRIRWENVENCPKSLTLKALSLFELHDTARAMVAIFAVSNGDNYYFTVVPNIILHTNCRVSGECRVQWHRNPTMAVYLYINDIRDQRGDLQQLKRHSSCTAAVQA